MIDPWQIIGWAIIAIVAGVTLNVTFHRGVAAISSWLAWRRSLKVVPTAGQTWFQESLFTGDQSRLLIKQITDSGRIVIETGSSLAGSSWSETPAEFEQRKRGRRLILEES